MIPGWKNRRKNSFWERSHFIKGFELWMMEPFAKVILQVVKKSRFFNYSPLSPEGGKGSRCAPVVSCPIRGKDVRRTRGPRSNEVRAGWIEGGFIHCVRLLQKPHNSQFSSLSVTRVTDSHPRRPYTSVVRWKPALFGRETEHRERRGKKRERKSQAFLRFFEKKLDTMLCLSYYSIRVYGFKNCCLHADTHGTAHGKSR